MILIPIIFGTILRVYKIWDNYFFTGELGKELIYTLQYLNSGSLPLIGMPTSHEWLNYGPIYYWILIPLIKVFGNSPYILYRLALAVSIIGIYVTYVVFKNIVSKRFAILLSCFVSVSPLWVWATRLSKLHTFFFLLSPLVIYFMYKIWSGNKRYMFPLGVAFGAIFSFHFSQLPIFIVILFAIFLKRKMFRLKHHILFFIGLIIPNITMLIYDAKNGFEMIRNLLLWIPYRIAGVLGFYSKNNFKEISGMNTLSAFNEFFGKNLFDDQRFWVLGSIIFFALFITFFIQNRKKYSKDFLVFYLITSTIVQCVALLIHTSPPIHYFFPIFLNFGMLFAFFASEYWIRKSSKILTITIFILLFAVGILRTNNEHFGDIDYIPFKNQNKLAREIVEDSEGNSFQVKRIGPFDYFPENYSQNYKYLILINGGKINPNSNLIYTIVESGVNVTYEKQYVKN